MRLIPRLHFVLAIVFAVNCQLVQAQNTPDELLLKGGYVLTMDPEIGDLAVGDVLVRDGQIIEIGTSLVAPEAEIIDASDMVIMPGFVETHWHMWNSSWRGMANDAAEYFRFSGVLAPHYTVEDHYIAVRYAALDALNAGITTVHNWAHGIRGFEDVQAEMRALVDTGIRAKMGYMAAVQGQATPAEDLIRARNWINENGVVSPLVYTETNNQPDLTMGAFSDASINERKSLGFNLQWDPTDRLSLALDYHDSEATRNPNSVYGSSAQVSMSIYGRTLTSVDYRNELPILTVDMAEPISPDDLQISGSVFNNY